MKSGVSRMIAFLMVVIAVIAFSSASQSEAQKPMYTTDVEVMDNGNILLSNKGSKDLRMYDPQMKLLKKWDFTEPVTSVVASKDNIYVTSSYAVGYLSLINAQTGKVEYKTTSGMGARAATLNGDATKVYVCNQYRGTVSEMDARSGKLLREVAVLREPCAAVMSKDGKWLFVNNFLPAQRADLDFVAADVSVIDLSNFTKVKDIKLDNGSNALRGIGISPDGKYVFVSHNLGRFQVPTSQLQQGWMNTSAVSVIDVASQNFVGSLLLDEPDRGAGGIWGIECDKYHLVVSQSGTHDISIVNYPKLIAKLEAYPQKANLSYDLYFMRDIRERLNVVGNGPRNMAMKDGKIYIPTYFSDTMNIITLSTKDVNAIAYNPQRVESKVDIGEKAFNDAAHCYQNWQSCNGCHPGDGRTDGMNWDLMNDGIGNSKNCKSMLFSHVTPPNMISGIRASAELAVRAGYKFIQFTDLSEETAVCVDDYLKSLKPLPSPYLVDGKLSAKAQAGRKVFEKLACDECHSGVYYTDMKMHRIGENVEFENGWDTPTLIEVWRTAPYLFNGRAATLREVFSEYKHGVNTKISDDEIDELTEYVNSL